jgi:hypothetical protein
VYPALTITQTQAGSCIRRFWLQTSKNNKASLRRYLFTKNKDWATKARRVFGTSRRQGQVKSNRLRRRMKSQELLRIMCAPFVTRGLKFGLCWWLRSGRPPTPGRCSPPSVMMLVKGGTGWKWVLCSRGDESIDVQNLARERAPNKKMQACCCTATKGINGNWDQTQWIEPCPKVSSTRLARRFFARWWLWEELRGCFCNW